MNKIITGGPAFPVSWNQNNPGELVAEPGMTLRQWYAGKVLSGMFANPAVVNERGLFNITNFAEAFKAADAMIAHEEKEGIK